MSHMHSFLLLLFLTLLSRQACQSALWEDRCPKETRISSRQLQMYQVYRVPTDLKNLENSSNLVKLENSWKTPGILS